MQRSLWAHRKVLYNKLEDLHHSHHQN